MERKRTVFLFGSGATLAWDSPTTSDLTTLIRETGFKTTDNKTTITEFIYTTLLANGYSTNEVNFETIISVIEELIVYYSQFNADTRIPSLLSSFLTSRYENELHNYSIKGETASYGYELQIPAGVEYVFSRRARHNETPPQCFFQQLLSLLLTAINARIHDYAYHTATHSVINVDSDTSKSFINWMKLLSGKSILRLYTLNYERIFKILLARAGMRVFEGFDCEEHIGPAVKGANVCRILSDAASHIHYNLHGSAFWEVRDLDRKLLPNPEIVLNPVFSLPLANRPASVQIERGKTLLVTTIVTGYQKAQRGMMTPFKQMQSAFDRDCCFADEIYVIGYSFGDEHINESMKMAIRHNKKLKVTIVDPNFIKKKMDYHQLALRFFPFRQDDNKRPKKVGDQVYSYFDDAFTVHTVGFKEFLESQLISGSVRCSRTDNR